MQRRMDASLNGVFKALTTIYIYQVYIFPCSYRTTLPLGIMAGSSFCATIRVIAKKRVLDITSWEVFLLRYDSCDRQKVIFGAKGVVDLSLFIEHPRVGVHSAPKIRVQSVQF